MFVGMLNFLENMPEEGDVQGCHGQRVEVLLPIPLFLGSHLPEWSNGQVPVAESFA